MRVGLDLTALLPEATGVDTYMLELVRHLAQADQANSYSVFVNREDRDRLPQLPERSKLYTTSTRNRGARLAWQQAGLPVLAAARRLQVVHSPAFILPLAARHVGHVLTVHDLTSFSRPETHLPLRRSRMYLAAVRASIRRADRICVPSHAVAAELRRLEPTLSPGRVRMIPHGVSSRFGPAGAQQAERVRQQLELRRPYVLYVGTIQPRKNLEMLLEAYRRLICSSEADVDLVLAGMLGWDYHGVLARAASPELRGRVRLLGYVDEELLPGLYAGARLLAYPSLEEGFGLPPLEAMACGTPVVASQSGALMENLRGAAELVPVDTPVVLMEAMHRLLTDARLHEARRRAGFDRAQRYSWQHAARATVACYRELVAGSCPPGPARRRRLRRLT